MVATYRLVLFVRRELALARLTFGTDSSGLAPMKKEQGECTEPIFLEIAMDPFPPRSKQYVDHLLCIDGRLS